MNIEIATYALAATTLICASASALIAVTQPRNDARRLALATQLAKVVLVGVAALAAALTAASAV